MNQQIPIFLVLVFAVIPADADIAPNPISGGLTLATRTAEECPVALVSESVLMTVNSDLTVTTHAEFILKNDGPELALTVGFPHYYADDFLSFSASVDRVSVHPKTDKTTKNYGRKTETTFWEVWEMQFPPDKNTIVEVDYVSRVPTSHEWVTADHFSPWYRGEEKKDILRITEIGTVTYILTTGSHWKGPIGKATIRADLSAFSSPDISEIFPNPEVIRTNEVLWELRDFEPKSDVGLSFFVNGPFDKVELLRSLNQQHPDDWYIAEALADEYLDERLRLYETFVMAAESLPPLDPDLGGEFLTLDQVAESAYPRTILRMATSLVVAYDRNLDTAGLWRISPKVLPMLRDFKGQLDRYSRDVRGKSSWLPSLEKAIPICERAIQEMNQYGGTIEPVQETPAKAADPDL